jgi:uncharacterized CHY-type Zn-finger protein
MIPDLQIPGIQIAVRGVDLDPNTRCAHYRSTADVIAIKMRCCQTYFSCFDCHKTLADHPPEVWPRAEWSSKAVLCGVCATEMTVVEYMDSGNRCPKCTAAFNPGCRNHYHLYFEDFSR